MNILVMVDHSPQSITGVQFHRVDLPVSPAGRAGAEDLGVYATWADARRAGVGYARIRRERIKRAVRSLEHATAVKSVGVRL